VGLIAFIGNANTRKARTAFKFGKNTRKKRKDRNSSNVELVLYGSEPSLKIAYNLHSD
jgi:hypothetical protein